MSWKGLQKAVSRLPHQILSKKSEATRDQEFISLESRFNEFTKIVDRLQTDALAFRDAVSALVSHQAAMASFLSVIYDSQLGAQAENGQVQRRFQPTSAAATQAVNDAEAAMAYCRDEILPELDAVDRFVVRPTLDLRDIMKTIQKTITKRNHKMIDYDRHRASLNKLKAKQERSFSEEKQIFKVEAQLATATQDYEYLNDMLKRELPQFFHLRAQFIQPLLERFYCLQCKIYGMIYARCYELVQANTQHFVTHAMPIEEGFNWRKSQYDGRAEIENLDLLKAGGKAWLSASGANSKLSLQERAALRQQENAGYGAPPPAYGSPNGVMLDSTPGMYGKKDPSWDSGHQRSTSRSGPAPPPPPPIANKQNASYVIALYDYDAQAEGDLSFRKDDKIEVLERTNDQNDWWTGRLTNGTVGIFPGNYVADLK